MRRFIRSFQFFNNINSEVTNITKNLWGVASGFGNIASKIIFSTDRLCFCYSLEMLTIRLIILTTTSTALLMLAACNNKNNDTIDKIYFCFMSLLVSPLTGPALALMPHAVPFIWYLSRKF